MNLTYSEIFEVRGDSYDGAMRRFPAARAAEFAALFRRRPLTGGESVLDAPSGGGYLGGHVPAGCRVTSLELSPQFDPDIPVVSVDGEWPVGSFDRALCLAALHHIEDQPGFAAKLISHTRPGGVVHLADVAAGDPIGGFLDEVVGRYNGTGHEGRYITADTFRGLDADVDSAEVRPCPWVFADEAAMVDFCMGLFGMKDCPPGLLASEMDRRVGVGRLAGGGVRLNWRLLYIDLAKPA